MRDVRAFFDKPHRRCDRRDGFLENDKHGWERGDVVRRQASRSSSLDGTNPARKLRRRKLAIYQPLRG